MKVFITGATGLIGSRLGKGLVADGAEVRALSRSARSDDGTGIQWCQGDPAVRGDWMEALAECDAVVHLAGESVASGRWTADRKQRLWSSRIDSTRLVVEAMEGGTPRTLVCASATGYYGPRGEEELREEATPGDDFLARICVDWEAEARAAEAFGARVVSLRFGVVLHPSGGALATMLLPFKAGLGGSLGPSDRWFPWIALDDAVALARFALEHEGLRGPVNAVSPGGVRMGEYAKTLARALGRPAFMPPVPLFALRLAMGEMGPSLVPGQRVVPAAADAAGFTFSQPELGPALDALLA